MRKLLLQLGVGVCWASVLAGCKHAEPKAAPCVNTHDCPSGKPGDLQTVPTPTQPTSPATPTPAPRTPLVEGNNKPRDLFVTSVAKPLATPLPAPQPAIVVPPDVPATLPDIIVPSTEPAPTEPTPTAKSFKGDRASDYRWVVGEVSYSSAKKTWRLRYAGLDAVDVYGGSVTLTGTAEQFEQLRDGQTIRVEGELLQRDPMTAPAYRVASLKVVE